MTCPRSDNQHFDFVGCGGTVTGGVGRLHRNRVRTSRGHGELAARARRSQRFVGCVARVGAVGPAAARTGEGDLEAWSSSVPQSVTPSGSQVDLHGRAGGGRAQRVHGTHWLEVRLRHSERVACRGDAVAREVGAVTVTV